MKILGFFPREKVKKPRLNKVKVPSKSIFNQTSGRSNQESIRTSSSSRIVNQTKLNYKSKG